MISTKNYTQPVRLSAMTQKATTLIGRISVFALCVSVLLSTPAKSDDVKLLPDEFTLYGREGSQLMALYELRDGVISASIECDPSMLRSSDESVVIVNAGRAIATGNGDATITATTADGRTATAVVHVADSESPHAWSFRHDVQSVLSKLGCNSGACHGALAGKGGFRLSLRGYDPFMDFQTITRESRGRRIEIANPGASLFLAKPTGALPHKGGIRLNPDSRDYRVLSEWIAKGASSPAEEDPQLVRISVVPENALLAAEQQTQVLVRAHYDDGRILDVTHWAQFTATDEAVASVTKDGAVTVRGSGEGAVLVWFGSKVALSRVTVPYENYLPKELYDNAAKRNFIDELNLQQLRILQLEPSPRCDDETFLRRATVDTIGRLPTKPERDQYLNEAESSRRDALIGRLLESDDFVDYWTYRWSDMLVINGTRLRPQAVKAYYEWVRTSVAANKPWDQFVREILTAQGVSTENGATNFYALHQSPEEMTENACQAFLGLSIGCAKCHNHPLEKWTNDQYYAMANLFARVRAKGWGGDGRNGDGVRTLYVTDAGELVQPNKGKPQKPAPLDSEPLEFDDPCDRRVTLANWMTDPSNPYFARAITNRVWKNFFARGLVEQVDDLRLSNPAANEALLDASAQHLIDAKFDLKQLMRTILQSETYQRSSLPLDTNKTEEKYLSRYYPRRMMAEVLLDSIDQVLETSTEFNQIAFPGADKQATDFYKKGTRAVELYDSAVDSYFLNAFGRNPREIVCECERSDEPSMVQVLHMSNGDTLNTKLGDSNNRMAKMIQSGADNTQIVAALFEVAFSRQPESDELHNILTVLDEYGEDRATGLQDAAWGILTSQEFTFNH